MYYCVACAEVHQERDAADWVFNKGFYIDPDFGTMVQFGVCRKEGAKDECRPAQEGASAPMASSQDLHKELSISSVGSLDASAGRAKQISSLAHARASKAAKRKDLRRPADSHYREVLLMNNLFTYGNDGYYEYFYRSGSL